MGSYEGVGRERETEGGREREKSSRTETKVEKVDSAREARTVQTPHGRYFSRTP